jgi:glutamate racemase
MSTVMNTVMTVAQICGMITLKKIWRSLAPSIRAASRVSTGTPLTAADSSTIEKPTWAQIRMTISRKLLKCSVLTCNQATGSNPRAVQTAFCRPICGSPAGRAS